MKRNPFAPAYHQQIGVTLLDYFAAAALPAVIARDGFRVGMGERPISQQAAEQAYSLAERMVDEKARREST